jgi:hypothetical protein
MERLLREAMGLGGYAVHGPLSKAIQLLHDKTTPGQTPDLGMPPLSAPLPPAFAMAAAASSSSVSSSLYALPKEFRPPSLMIGNPLPAHPSAALGPPAMTPTSRFLATYDASLPPVQWAKPSHRVRQRDSPGSSGVGNRVIWSC